MARSFKQKLQTKLQNPITRFVAVLAIVAFAWSLVIGGQWISNRHNSYLLVQARTVTTYQPKVIVALREELQPIKAPLTAMRFNDLDNIQSHCYYNSPLTFIDDLGMEDAPRANPRDYTLDCAANVSRIVRLPQDVSGKQQFLEQAIAFDKTLQTNGWKPSGNTSTSEWFQKLLAGNTSQIAHEFSKGHNDLRCNLSFWTNYTSPEPPAVGAAVACLKPSM